MYVKLHFFCDVSLLVWHIACHRPTFPCVSIVRPCHIPEGTWSEEIFIRISQTSIRIIICGHSVKIRNISTTFYCYTAQLPIQTQENKAFTRRTSGKFKTTDVRNYVGYEFFSVYWPSRWRSLLITPTPGRTNVQSSYWKRTFESVKR